jgi:chitinase
MTYDFTAGSQGDAYTGHHTQPKGNSNDPIPDRKLMSADLAAKYYVQNGAMPSKVNLGVAFYARGFLIPNVSVNQGPFFPSLGGITFGTWEVGEVDYYDLKNNYMTNDSLCFDSLAQAPYIVNNTEGWFLTYDDVESIQQKVNLVEFYEYDGLFAYELTGDDDNFTLLNSMRRNATFTGSSKHSPELILLMIIFMIILL